MLALIRDRAVEEEPVIRREGLRERGRGSLRFLRAIEAGPAHLLELILSRVPLSVTSRPASGTSR
jgi:hypothetical protein